MLDEVQIAAISEFLEEQPGILSVKISKCAWNSRASLQLVGQSLLGAYCSLYCVGPATLSSEVVRKGLDQSGKQIMSWNGNQSPKPVADVAGYLSLLHIPVLSPRSSHRTCIGTGPS